MTAVVNINLSSSSPQAGSGFYSQTGAASALMGGSGGGMGGLAAGLMGGASGAGSSLMAGVSGLAGMLGKAGPLGLAVLGITETFKFLETTTYKLIDAFNHQISTFGKFSPAVQAALGTQQVKDVRADIRRANSSGQDLAGFVNAQSELNRTIEDIKIAFLKPFLKIVTKIMEDSDELLETIGPAIEGIGEVLASIFDFIRWAVTEIVKMLSQLPILSEYLKQWRDDWKRRFNEDIDTNDVEDFLDPSMVARFMGGEKPAGWTGDWVPAG